MPAFAPLPADVLEALASGFAEEHHAAGSIVVTEGEVGEKVYLIAAGRAEVSTQSPAGPVTLATLEAGEIFGELALLSPPGQRTATVTALTPLLTLTLAAPAFHALLHAHPETRGILEEAAETMRVARFLKRASPFTALDTERVRHLAARLEPLSVPAGATIVRQGEPGDACYLVRSGRVEVLAEDEGSGERRLSTLGPGTIVGEAALLTEAPRSATVRALEPCDLLVLHRSALLDVLGADRQIAAEIVDLLLVRDRPRQAPGIVAQQRTTPEGETITILKDPHRGAYYRLSPQGWFLWQRMDGQHTVRDLTVAYLGTFKAFAPEAVIQLVRGLAAAGFVASKALRPDVAGRVQQLSGWQRAAVLARRVLEWQISLRNVDAVVTRLYRGGLWVLYTRPAQVLLGLLALAGPLAFALSSVRAGAAFAGKHGGGLLLFFIPANLLAIVVHEAGHACTTKAWGRAVNRIGLGWYWFGPVAFVDTSDMWLAERWPRIAVSLAGPYANALLGGLAALAAWLTPSPVATAALWQFALASYLMVVANLNPLLEYDGYYILMDLLERPNLRPHALAWLGRNLLPALRSPARLRAHAVEVLYGWPRCSTWD